MTSPVAAHSPSAEREFLGTCLLYADARDLLAKELEPDDFYVPAHRTAAEAITHLHRAGSAVDPSIVARWVVEHHGRDVLEALGGLAALVSWMGDAPGRATALTNMLTVRDRASRRHLKAALLEGLNDVEDLAVPVAEVVDGVQTRVRGVDLPVRAEPSLNVLDFLDRDMDYRWLVPGWLERQDRTLLTGGEKQGKSVLLRQLAVQMASGVHPWRRRRPDPVNVLIYDLENSERQVWRLLRVLIDQVAQTAQGVLGHEPPLVFEPDRLRVEVRPGGLDLLTRADRNLFTGKVAASNADVVVTGPIYKMHSGGIKDEDPAAELVAYLDRLRAEYDVALIIEAHSPYSADGGTRRTLRPIGSSIWARWPEFGYGIRKVEGETGVYDFESWIPPRDDNREWPSRIRRSGGKSWPWINHHLPEEEVF